METKFSKDELEHQRKLFSFFSSTEWPVLQVELESYKKDLINYMAGLDVSDKQQQLEHIKYRAKLDLVELWLNLPEENKNFLIQFKDLFVGLFN